jgi:arylsulfatase A-like enzyme
MDGESPVAAIRVAACAARRSRARATKLPPVPLIVLAAILGFTALRGRADEAPARPPNVIVILVDDLGAGDLSCQGSRFHDTPHIDRLAAAGIRFTAGYAACTVCSPTRAALLTGQSPARLHITDWIAGHENPQAKLRIPDWQKQLPLEAVTLAERLSGAGYATASIGKWHLGGADHGPEQQGFDINIAGTDRGQPPSYFSPYKISTLPDGPDGEYLTDRLTAEAVAFLEANRDRPFFLSLPHFAVHTPLQAKPDVEAKYVAAGGLPDAASRAGKPIGGDKGFGQSNATYAAMVESVDDSVGRIVETLDRLGLRDTTAIFFTSDNGGLLPVTDNRPLRAGKGSAWEGGVRVPFIVSWPGVTSPGTTSSEPVITMDIPATILDLTGVGPEPGQPIDGVSLAPVFRGDSLDRHALHWHYPHYHPGGATPHSAIRAADWRLVHFHEDGHDELYNLRDDPGERTDRAAAEPARAAGMRRDLEAWLGEVGAQLPTPNPGL